MTLVDIVQQLRIEIPQQKAPAPVMNAYCALLTNQIGKLIKQQGAFFRLFEFLQLDTYARQQGLVHDHVQDISNRIHKLLRPTLLSLTNTFKLLYGPQSAIVLLPSNVRDAQLWYQDQPKMLRYLQTLIGEHTSHQDQGRTVHQVTLAEPYLGILSNKNGHDPALGTKGSFRDPIVCPNVGVPPS